MGMLGKSWSTGALMMVQVADTLPRGFHPRTKLEGILTYSPSPSDEPDCTPSARLSYGTVNSLLSTWLAHLRTFISLEIAH